jgi:hypothetical protein
VSEGRCKNCPFLKFSDMIIVKDFCKEYNVPYKGKTLGTLDGEDLKKYLKAYLESNYPEQLLKYFDNTMEELTKFALDIPAKKIKKPKNNDDEQKEQA